MKTIILFNAIFKENFFWAVVFASVVSFFSYFLKFLSKSGAFTTFILAFVIFAFGSWKWTIPIITFFILSSLLSRIKDKKNNNENLTTEKNSVRDCVQVLANGSTGGILVIINQFIRSELLFIMYASSIAAVCSDTWATEIGNLFKSKTYNILNFKSVDPGISGGISFIGTLAAVAGALVIGFVTVIWIDMNQLSFLLLITLSGFLGSIVDSYLGASVQVQYECENCGKITEQKMHCGSLTKKVKGFNWINNDTVNFAASLSGILFFTFFNFVI